jgi:hypothetical protein
MRLTKTKVILAAVAITVAVAGGGVAFAIWNASGTGSGTGAAAVASSLTITPVFPTGAQANIYPGGPAGAVYFTVDNPNPFPVTLTSVAYGTPFSTNTTSCPSANISVDTGAPTTLSISVPANTTTGTESISGVLDLAHAAPNGCQGVGFSVALTVTGTQQ